MKKYIIISLIGISLFIANNAFADTDFSTMTSPPYTAGGHTYSHYIRGQHTNGGYYITFFNNTATTYNSSGTEVPFSTVGVLGSDYWYTDHWKAYVNANNDITAGATWGCGNSDFSTCNYNESQSMSLPVPSTHFSSDVDVYYQSTLVYTGLYPVATLGITASTPADHATGVNAYTTFTGTYDNDGTFDTVIVALDNLDQHNVPLTLIVCSIATIGTSVPFECHYSGSTNTHYQWNVGLWDSTSENPYPTEGNYVNDSEGPYVYTTGTVYETTTPSTSSTCSGFDIGCYLENALSWFFGVDQETLNQFTSLTLKNSLPFSYIYDTGNLYTELFSGSPQDIDIAIAFGSFGNITLLSTDKLNAVPFHGTVRTILGAMMIFMTAMFLYGKIIGIHDKQEVAKV